VRSALKINNMNDYTVKRLALILAIQAEIEGMKAENMQREQQGYSMAWTESDFFEKAEELRQLAYKHDEQLYITHNGQE
jgi:hypothetical protein